MIKVNKEKCISCSLCSEVCPLNAIIIQDKKPEISDTCSNCGACVKICPSGALSISEEIAPNRVKCQACPIECQILEGYSGACRRYVNIGGKIVKRHKLLVPKSIDYERLRKNAILSRPIITGIGAGTKKGRLAGFLPAPYIVHDEVEGIDIVTCATEAPLSYCGLFVKIDTDFYIGEEGADVLRRGFRIGHVTMEQYGSKILSIGGVNLLTGKTGIITAKTIIDILRGEVVELEIKGGRKMKIQLGKPPVIDGKVSTLVKGGCGSSAVGYFGDLFKEVADEVIILDSHITGLASEHLAGEIAGMKYSGVKLAGRKSTRGRYFMTPGDGWGGTNIMNPLDAIIDIDMNIAKPGMRILITESFGQRAKMFELTKEGKLKEMELTEKAKEAVQLIAENCEESRVSAILIGGAGGEVRKGVTKYPKKLTQAVKEGLAYLTIGGAPTFILPGSGLNFMVDVEKVLDRRAFTWVPTPAIVVPIEFTMERSVFESIGGYIKELRKKSEIIKVEDVEYH